MFCSRCGSEITGKSKFCPSCGLDLMATTPVQAIATGALEETDLVREALAAEYEIIEELGRGGMAMVYRARDRHLEREVAIKVLPFSLAFDSEFVERFQREARTAAQLEHPNIISIYRVGRAGRVIYFVMKYLRGGSVATVLAERRKLMPPEIRRLLIEAGSALGYAAQRGIVHRDIKPDNIMFDEFGMCVLTDFGIAKAASGQRLTGTGMSIGTPHYMSPEQARAQSIDGRSDIYSLGVVAYQALAGTVPYDGEDSFSIGYKHITEPVPTPQLITADERRVFDVIKRMLMKDPNDRFQSCEELVASLQGQPTAASGSLRASLATASMVSGTAPTRPSPAMGAPALIVSQPTTPIESPLVNRRQTPNERRDNSRRVADRSVAMRRTSASAGLGWVWLVLAIAAGIGGAFYYYQKGGFAPFAAVVGDSAAARQAATLPADSAGAATPSPVDSARAPAPAPAPGRLRTQGTRRRSGRTAGPAPSGSASHAAGHRRLGRQRRHPAVRPAARIHGADRRAHGRGAGHDASRRPPRARGLRAAVPVLHRYGHGPPGRHAEDQPDPAPARRRGTRARLAGARCRVPAAAGRAVPDGQPLLAGPRLQLRRLLLRRAAQAGERAVRPAAGRSHRLAAPVAALGEGLRGGTHD